jgi:hypothetical protein
MNSLTGQSQRDGTTGAGHCSCLVLSLALSRRGFLLPIASLAPPAACFDQGMARTSARNVNPNLSSDARDKLLAALNWTIGQ